MISIFYAMEKKTLEKYWSFREAENRVKKELTSERIGEIRAASDAAEDSKPLYTVENDVANIDIVGMLTPKRTLSASLFSENETTYADIIKATEAADADISVLTIRYHVDTSGGAWDMCDLAAQAIASAQTPTEAVIYAKACSAGYYLASQTGKITCASRASIVGSIGVVTEIFDRTMENEKKGVKRIVITNTASSDKRPDPATEDGYATIQAELDDIYAIFEERVIEGRASAGVTLSAETIRSLKGGVVTARKAMKLGLIDEVLGLFGMTANKENQAPVGGSYINTEGSMNSLSEFLEKNPQAKAEHESLVAQARTEGSGTAKAEGIKEGEALATARILSVLDLSAVTMSAETKTAIESGQSPEAYAMAALKAAKGQAPKPNASALGGSAATPSPAESAAAAGLQPDKYANGRVGVDELFDEKEKK